MKLSFLGGAGTVTGSKYAVAHETRTVLIDCGLFQGLKALRLKNWALFPIEPHAIDAVILTHAHIDHSGYLPLLIKRGFKGSVLCSRATADLCAILLPGAGHLQKKVRNTRIGTAFRNTNPPWMPCASWSLAREGPFR